MAARHELFKVNVLALEDPLEDLMPQPVGLVHRQTLHKFDLIEVGSILEHLYVLLLHPVQGHHDVPAVVYHEDVVHTLDEVLVLLVHRQPSLPPNPKCEDVSVGAMVEVHTLLCRHDEPTDDRALAELQSVHLLGVELVANVVLARHDEVHFGRGLQLRA